MRNNLISIVFLLLVICGCSSGNRDQDVTNRLQEVKKKERQLAAWELRLKDEEKKLKDMRLLLDSAKKEIDSSSMYDPAIVGIWTVKMSCTETTCEGSAIGDTKTEQWDLSYNAHTVVVRAYSGRVLSRIYTGKYKDDILTVMEEKPGTDVTIRVVLNFANKNRIEGTREIIQPTCKIVYSLTAEPSK